LEIVAGFQKMNGRNDLLRIQLKIINHLPLPFTDFQIQLAVPKVISSFQLFFCYLCCLFFLNNLEF